MSTVQRIVIVGASLAGAKAAETLRTEGYEGDVVLVGEEPERPYERPPLSKDYLRGEAERAKAYVHDEDFYASNDIELRTGTRAEAVDPAGGEVALAGGERLSFDRLLIATGAEPRRLPVPGADLDGVLYLRTFADSDTLRDRINAAERVLVVGAGWIGAEVAASARQMGRDVTMIEQAALPLERVLGPELGEIYRDIHADHGVRYMGGTALEAFEGAGRVERARLAGVDPIDCDLAVVGVGVTPRTGLAEAAGLDVDNGILVSDRLESSAPGIFAAGDVANAVHPFYGTRIRMEHWANALNQGSAAARNMLGADVAYERLPYFYSDQYDVGMEYSGYATDWDEVVIRGDAAAREFIAFWVKDGRVLAGMNVNVWDVTDQIQALIRSRAQVDRAPLADPGVALDDLA